MEQGRPSVVLGKPMRKFKPSLLPEEDIDSKKTEKCIDSDIVPELSPAKAVKTLLEQNFENKQTGTVSVQQESVGADKRLLLSALSSKKAEFSFSSGWTPFSYVSALSDSQMQMVRRKFKIIVEGSNIPPLALKFKDMRIPNALLEYLEKVKSITTPSLIQMQGIPVALSGRDLIGIASTGSGKTLSFCIPLILIALEAEMKLPLIAGEGPIGIILAPSRELARQTFQQCLEISEFLHLNGLPELRIVNLIGGLSPGEQLASLSKGIHIVVGTPGRTLDFLNKGHIYLHGCRQICLDEADRMIDLGFEEELRGILGHCKTKVQMLLFSATMPTSIKDFALNALSNPILINVGRAGAANLNIVQEVELVDKNKRLDAILDSLQKTAPPVIIFASSKSEVDDVLEFLLLKGIEAVAIHGGKSQEERIYAIDSFKSHKKDVLVANDIASKGIDLQNIQHVINYDLPNEIEDYVHRIGRTGRGGSTGIATTFVDPTICSEAVLLDLKLLLAEAQQNIPSFLENFGDLVSYTVPCSICGGLGHGVDKCPKIGAMASKQLSNIRASINESEY